MTWKKHFSKFLQADASRLHFAAHSHHPWPDVTQGAHAQAWLDAARLVDDKWDHIFSKVVPEARRGVAASLSLPSTDSVVFATSTHELLLRVLSCFPAGVRILSSDSEFHSFDRQARRLEEAGVAQVTRVPAEPFATFGQRLVEASQAQVPDLVFLSQVFFNSGAAVDSLDSLVSQLPPQSWVVIDGYHGFLARPTDFSRLAPRAFYMAGGYKYAMAGEGACFMHVPPHALDARPRNTGWFAAFGALEEKASTRVPYASGAAGWAGATFDPTGLYRFNAVMRWRREQALTPDKSLTYVHGLAARFVAGLSGRLVVPNALVVPLEDSRRGQFLTFRTPRAKELVAALKGVNVVTDARDDRFRVGFGVYQDEADVDALLERLKYVTHTL